MQGRNIAAAAPSNGQALKWNGVTSQWEPSTDNNTTYSGGTGIEVTDNIISNTQPNAIHSGDATGGSTLTVVKLQGRDLANTVPTNGQALKWNEITSKWEPSTDENTTYTNGPGIDIIGTIISNTSPDQTVSLSSGTGISTSGTYPNFTVTNSQPNATHTGDAVGSSDLLVIRIQGRDIDTAAPTNGQALKWNEITSKWEPSTDENTTYTSGTGIDIIGTTISNASPDQIVSLSSGTGISTSGTYPNFTVTNTQPNATHTGDAIGSEALTVVKLQGRDLSDAAPSSGQVIKWNGSAWVPSNETDPALPSGSGYATLYHNGINWVTSSLLYNTNQRIGIGTSNPNQQLEITGNFRLPASSATAGNFYKGSNVFIHNKGTDNIYVGENSGSLNATANNNTALGAYSLYSVTSGHSQTAIGSSALRNTTSGQQNTAVGYWAMYSNTTGSYNTALGYKAISANTSGTENTAAGYQSLMSNSTGTGNTAIGFQSLINNSLGNQNTGVGDWALKSNTNGSGNTAVGYYSMNSSTLGEYNTSIGAASLYCNKANSRSTAIGYNAMNFADDRTSGRETYNTAVGYEALKGSSTPSENTGQYNTAIGDQAILSQTSGSKNTALGRKALYANTSGWENTAIGENALSSNTANSRNTAIGFEALKRFNSSSGTSTNNTALGYRAGYGTDNSTGVNNIFIGYQAGDSISSGSNNIIIGYDIDLPLPAGNSQMVLGNANALYGDLINNYIGIGTTAPHAPLQLGNNAANRKIVIYEDANNDHQYFGFGINTAAMRYQIAGTDSDHIFYAGNGSSSSNELARIKGNGTLRVSSLSTNGPVYSNNNILTNTNPSDRNLKDNILPIGNSLEKVLALRPVTFIWKSNSKPGVGFIAQEVEEVIPELVNTNDDGTKGIYSLEMIPYLVKALQEQQIVIEQLKIRIQHLEQQPK